MHAEVRIGDSMLMMGGGIPGREFRSTANTHALHIYVEDADMAYQRALAAGASSLGEPQDQEYGERSASVKDPAGNYWYIATHKGESYVPKGLNDVNVYMHPLRAAPVISFLKTSIRRAGDCEVRIARWRRAPCRNPCGKLVGGDGRVAREISANAHDVLPLRAGLRRRLPPCLGCRSHLNLRTRRPALW